MHQNLLFWSCKQNPRKPTACKYTISYQNNEIKCVLLWCYYHKSSFTETKFRYICICWYFNKQNIRVKYSFRKIVILFWKSCKQGRTAAWINIHQNKPSSALVYKMVISYEAVGFAFIANGNVLTCSKPLIQCLSIPSMDFHLLSNIASKTRSISWGKK